MQVAESSHLINNELHQKLKKYIFTKLNSYDETEDLLQEVYLKLLTNDTTVNKAYNKDGYIFGIAKNLIIDKILKSKKYTTESIIDTVINDDEIITPDLNSKFALCCIQKYVNKLPDVYREAILLTEFQNLSQKDLAIKLNISYSGAKSRVQRGKEKLKALLMECCEFQYDVYGNLLEEPLPHCK